MKPITAEQERTLFEAYKSGERGAENRIVEQYLLLVPWVLRTRVKYPRSFYDDLIQEGRLGLLTAIRRFDLEFGTRFSTYATFWISAFQRKYLNAYNDHGTGASGSNVGRKSIGLLRRGYTPEEVAAQTGFSIEKIEEVGRTIPAPLSLDYALGDDRTLHDELPSESCDPLERLEQLERKAAVDIAIYRLSERERRVYRGRAAGKTLQEIGDSMDLSRERIRQIEAECWSKVRLYMQNYNDAA